MNISSGSKNNDHVKLEDIVVYIYNTSARLDRPKYFLLFDFNHIILCNSNTETGL